MDFVLSILSGLLAWPNFASYNVWEKLHILLPLFKVSVYAAEDSIHAAQFSLERAVSIIDYYEEFFGVNYPLPKQGNKKYIVVYVSLNFILSAE